jgi:hypothetical protein
MGLPIDSTNAFNYPISSLQMSVWADAMSDDGKSNHDQG